MSTEKETKKTGPGRGITVKDVPADAFIAAYARHLKRSGRVEVPKWADIVKTGHFKELCPQDADWFYVRTASVARKLYLRGGTGISTFQRVYGGRQRRGSCPPHFARGSGAVIRAAVKQLEALKVVEKDPKGGRKLTSTGRRDLDRIAAHLQSKH